MDFTMCIDEMDIESGASIGVDAKRSGTVGGHLRPTYADGKTEILGTTNYRVVRPDHATVVATGSEILNNAWDSKYEGGKRPAEIIGHPIASDYTDVKHLNTSQHLFNEFMEVDDVADDANDDMDIDGQVEISDPHIS